MVGWLLRTVSFPDAFCGVWPAALVAALSAILRPLFIFHVALLSREYFMLQRDGPGERGVFRCCASERRW